MSSKWECTHLQFSVALYILLCCEFAVMHDSASRFVHCSCA